MRSLGAWIRDHILAAAVAGVLAGLGVAWLLAKFGIGEWETKHPVAAIPARSTVSTEEVRGVDSFAVERARLADSLSTTRWRLEHPVRFRAWIERVNGVDSLIAENSGFPAKDYSVESLVVFHARVTDSLGASRSVYVLVSDYFGDKVAGGSAESQRVAYGMRDGFGNFDYLDRLRFVVAESLQANGMSYGYIGTHRWARVAYTDQTGWHGELFYGSESGGERETMEQTTRDRWLQWRRMADSLRGAGAEKQIRVSTFEGIAHDVTRRSQRLLGRRR